MPLYSKKHIKSGIVALWQITETDSELIAMLPESWTSKLDISKMSRHNLAARVLAFTVCPDFTVLEKDEYGKPYFESEKHKISITHAGDFAAFMLKEDDDCGIDMEKINPRIERIRHKFINEGEEEYIRQGMNGLFMVWCAKEALYKYYGLKSLDFKKHLFVKPTDLKSSGSLNGSIHKNEYHKEIILDYEFFGEYLLVHTT